MDKLPVGGESQNFLLFPGVETAIISGGVATLIMQNILDFTDFLASSFRLC